MYLRIKTCAEAKKETLNSKVASGKIIHFAKKANSAFNFKPLWSMGN